MNVRQCRKQQLEPFYVGSVTLHVHTPILDLPVSLPSPFLSNSSSLKWNLWTLRVSDRVSHTLMSNEQQYNFHTYTTVTFFFFLKKKLSYDVGAEK